MKQGDVQGSTFGSRRSITWALAVIAGLAVAWLLSTGLQAQAKKVSGSLTTLFASDNGNDGVTFDLDVLPRGGVVVKRLDANVDTAGTTETIEIWTRPGTAEGFETNEEGWTSQGTAVVTSAGEENRTPVPIRFRLEQGSYGVAIGFPGSNPDLGIQYTAGADTFENDVLRLTSGRGLGDPIFDGGGLSGGRIFNGTIYYRVPCEAAKKKLKRAKKAVKKAKRQLADAVGSGDAQDAAVAEQKLERKQKKLKKAKRKKKRACA